MLLLSIKQIFRGLWKYKGFTLINLLGLSTGIAAVILIYLIADYEKKFDRFHSQVHNVFRVVSQSEKGGEPIHEANAPYPAAQLLRTEYPGLKATEIHFSDNVNVRIGNGAPFEEKNILFADSLFFSVLDFGALHPFALTGDPLQALSAPNKVILTQSTAQRYFGNANPIGQVLKLDAQLEVEVAAIVKDPPPTTHLPFSMIISYPSLTPAFIGGFQLDNWGFKGGGFCYVRLDKGASVPSVEKAFARVVQKAAQSDRDRRDHYYLQPLSQIHFDPLFETANPTYTISSRYLSMLLLLGLVILLIACINYINLSTSLAFTKSKEIGIRKTIGASKKQLFVFYMAETALLTFFAALAGIAIAVSCLPLVNHLLDKSLSTVQLTNPSFVLAACAGVLVVSFISGMYPALILAGFRPIESLKNHLPLPGKASTTLRKSLVVFQFTISIVLIICTLVIARQMQYFNSKSLGFNKDAVVEVGLPSPDSAKIEAFRSQLQNQAGIRDLSFCLGAPISENGISTSMKSAELADEGDYSVKILACDRQYLSTYGIELIAGRWFLPGEEKNLGSGLVVNQTLVSLMGYRDPAAAIGKKITIGVNQYNPPIIGVVKDFHTSSLHEKIAPAALMPFPYFYYAAGVRIEPGQMGSSLARIEAAFKKVYPEYVYQLHFIDEQLAKLYEQDERNYNIFRAFSAISLFICCIGLWGLIAFVVVRKTKEIGIRKVLGATVGHIVALLSRDFLLLVLLALVIASPISWYLMQRWLQDFAYRIDIRWWVFGLAGLFALLITLVTISFQAVKAAMANPVNNLRTE